MDVLGNCTTDLPASALDRSKKATFRIRGTTLHGLAASYAGNPPGCLVAVINSNGYLEITAAKGSAAQVLGAQVGDIVEIKT